MTDINMVSQQCKIMRHKITLTRELLKGDDKAYAGGYEAVLYAVEDICSTAHVHDIPSDLRIKEDAYSTIAEQTVLHPMRGVGAMHAMVDLFTAMGKTIEKVRRE